jgi:hypothetical protein
MRRWRCRVASPDSRPLHGLAVIAALDLLIRFAFARDVVTMDLVVKAFRGWSRSSCARSALPHTAAAICALTCGEACCGFPTTSGGWSSRSA